MNPRRKSKYSENKIIKTLGKIFVAAIPFPAWISKLNICIQNITFVCQIFSNTTIHNSTMHQHHICINENLTLFWRKRQYTTNIVAVGM